MINIKGGTIMSANKTLSHMCKSARAMGLPKNKWLLIEDHISKILQSSGPEYLISYLKEIKEAKVAQITGAPVSLNWHKKNSKGEPAGWQAIIWKLKPKTCIQVLGSMVNSITLTQLSDKQLDKWKSSVRSPIRDDNPELYLRDKVAINNHLTKDLEKMEKSLIHHIQNQEPFDLADITGTSIPVGKYSITINRKTSEQRYLESLGKAFLATINSAPTIAGGLVLRNSQYRDNQDFLSEAYNLAIAARVKNEGLERAYYPTDRDWSDNSISAHNLVGQIAFLQQEGGKLRTIANPNRYLQYSLKPLQKAISGVVNSKSTVCVTDQHEGIAWAQRKLAENVMLHSFDLSAATDLLSMELFESCLDRTDWKSRYPVFYDNFQAFLGASEAQWYSPDLKRQVSWKVGQPLGLNPSFATLTWMNNLCGTVAAEFAGLDPKDAFRVVGDDLICDERMANCYSRLIRSFNGKHNPEKEIVSNKYGEFCSQLITAKTHFALKPKIRGFQEAYFTDLNKGKPKYHVPESFKEIADYLSEWSSGDINNLPSYSSSNLRSFQDRITASLYIEAAAQAKNVVRTEREAPLGPILNLAIEGESESDPISNLILGDIPEFTDPFVRTRVPSQPKLRYAWRSDTYEYLTSDITRAKSLARQLKEFENSYSGEPISYFEFKDPYHTDRKIGAIAAWTEGAIIVENYDEVLSFKDKVNALQYQGIQDNQNYDLGCPRVTDTLREESRSDLISPSSINRGLVERDDVYTSQGTNVPPAIPPTDLCSSEILVVIDDESHSPQDISEFTEEDFIRMYESLPQNSNQLTRLR